MTFGVDRRKFALSVVASLAASAASASAKGTMLPGGSTSRVPEPLFYGAAARADQLDADPALADLFRSNCRCITPEIHLKWDAVQPEPGRYAFSAADDLIRFAYRNDMGVRGHTLLWDQSTPPWAKKELLRRREWSLVRRHFETVLGRYAAAVAEWDVINEPIDSEEDDGLRRTVFYRAFGPEYIARAMEDARSIAPSARLAINDYGFDYANPVEEKRRRRFVKLMEDLKRDGVPIDSVGIQGHLDLAKGPIDKRVLSDFFGALGALGLDIVVTELDVKEADRSGSVEVRDARVAAEVRSYLEVALAEPAVRGVVTWGLSDRHSWLQPHPVPAGKHVRPERLNRGLPYDAQYRPKPLHHAIQGLIARGRPAALSG
jgi:endo-1,4-beta-xylanase